MKSSCNSSCNNNNNNNNNNNSYNSNNERLFWLIFKNKVLNIEILSKLNNNNSSSNSSSHLFNYERLIDAEYILNNFTNGIEIVRDKVKCGSYLVKNSLHSIYKLITKETKENIQFYNQLFSNYPNYFTINDELIVFINSTNTLALKLFIKKFKVKNNELFEIVMSTGSQVYGGLNRSYKGIKVLDYLIQYHNFKLGERFGFNLFEGWLSYNNLNIKQVIKLLKIIINLKQDNNSNSNNNNNNNNNNKKKNKNKNKNNNNNNNSSSSNKYDAIQSFIIENIDGNSINNSLGDILNEIESYQFNLLELSTPLLEILQIINYINNNHPTSNNDNISSGSSSDCNNNNINQKITEFNNNINHLKSIIYKIIYLFYTIYINEENKIYNKDYKEQIKSKLTSSKFNINCFKFIFNFLNNNNNKNNSSNNNTPVDNSNNNNSSNNSSSSSNSIMKYYFQILFKNHTTIQNIQSIIQLDNLELIKIIHSFQDTKVILDSMYQTQHNLKQIIGSIKSKDILEFYYNNYQHIFFGNKNQNWQYVNSIEIIEYYELLMRQLGHMFLIDWCYVNESDESIVLELLYRALTSGISSCLNDNRGSNSSGNSSSSNGWINNNGCKSSSTKLYLITEKFINTSSFINLFNKYINNGKQDIVISILKLFKSESVRLADYSNNNKVPVKLIHWFVNNISNKSIQILSQLKSDPRYALPSVPTIKFKIKLSTSSTSSINKCNDCFNETEFSITYNLLLYLLIANNQYNEALSVYCNDPRIIFDRPLASFNSTNHYLNSFIHHSYNHYFELVNHYNNNNSNPSSVVHNKEFQNIGKLINKYLFQASINGNIEIFKLLNIHQLAQSHLECLDPIIQNPKSLLINAITQFHFEIVDILLNNNINLSIDEFNQNFKALKIQFKLFSTKFK